MPPTERLEIPGFSVEFGPVPWDTAACGFPVGQVSVIRLGQPDPAALQDTWSRYEAWRDAAGLGLVSCRLAMDQVAEGQWLESAGFRFIELVLQPALDLAAASGGEDPRLRISPAGTGDLGPIGRIAQTALVTDRFTVDPRLPRGASGIRYRRWVESVPGHPTQRLFKIEEDGLLAAFFITEARPDGTCYWHLTAVEPALQGRGYGKRIWRAMLAQARAGGSARVLTTIAVRNLPVVNLYAALGFRFTAPAVTFHWMRA